MKRKKNLFHSDIPRGNCKTSRAIRVLIAEQMGIHPLKTAEGYGVPVGQMIGSDDQSPFHIILFQDEIGTLQITTGLRTRRPQGALSTHPGRGREEQGVRRSGPIIWYSPET